MEERTVTKDFEEFEEFCCVNDIPLENVMNYDETNLNDDPGKKSVIIRRG